MAPGVPIPFLLKNLDRLYPKARSALHFSKPLEMLVAAILAAQCTDARVNLVTPALFKKYPNAAAYARAKPSALQAELRSINFYRNKAANIQKACRILVESYGGKVPATLEELTALPGVGRKTANMLLANSFGVPGVIVDTHVKRVAYRLGLTRSADPEQIERDLQAALPKRRWALVSHQLTAHGRELCKAPRPFCSRCPLAVACPRAGVSASK
ncbi:MAG: endonuclease III [bacterium]